MGAFLPFLILIGRLTAVLGLFAWLATRIRRRGLGRWVDRLRSGR